MVSRCCNGSLSKAVEKSGSHRGSAYVMQAVAVLFHDPVSAWLPCVGGPTKYCCSSLCCKCAMLNSQANCNKEAMCPLHERSMMVGGAHAREEFAKVPTGQLGGLPTIDWAATVEVHPCCSCFSSQLPCCNALINLLCGYLYTCHRHRDTSKDMFVSIPGCLSGETRCLCQACSIACASKDKIC